jgi:NAD(P)-dependent dehydrogenase (short-subunit alcohol dehydrogenase family)
MPNSKFDLKGKVALVTGGNGGIGLGMAEALAEAGADVCIWGRNADKNKDAEGKLQLYGQRVLALQCDVSDENQVERCFERTIEDLGRVDACFANAGIGELGTPFHEPFAISWIRGRGDRWWPPAALRQITVCRPGNIMPPQRRG